MLAALAGTIANTCFVLLITLAGVTLIAGTVFPGELIIKDLLPRVVFASWRPTSA